MDNEDGLFCDVHAQVTDDERTLGDPYAERDAEAALCPLCTKVRVKATANKVLREWSATVVRNMTPEDAGIYLGGVELGLHMAITSDFKTATMLMMLFDLAVHDGRGDTHLQAAQASALLRVLSVDQIEVIDTLMAALDPLVAKAGLN